MYSYLHVLYESLFSWSNSFSNRFVPPSEGNFFLALFQQSSDFVPIKNGLLLVSVHRLIKTTVLTLVQVTTLLYVVLGEGLADLYPAREHVISNNRDENIEHSLPK